jgi:hypothetical protein
MTATTLDSKRAVAVMPAPTAAWPSTAASHRKQTEGTARAKFPAHITPSPVGRGNLHSNLSRGALAPSPVGRGLGSGRATEHGTVIPSP